MNKQARIETAFNRLPLLKEITKEHLKTKIDRIASIKPTIGEPYIGFKKIGRTGCKKELDELRKHAECLVSCIDNLHEPSIRALSNVGYGRFGMDCPIDANNDRMMLKELCEKVAEAAKRADVSWVPLRYGAGRPEEIVANATARELAIYYHELTGKKPTVNTKTDPRSGGAVSYGPFLEFVEIVFKAIGIKAAAGAAVSQAIKNTKQFRETHFTGAAIKKKNTNKK